jgi:poly(3-hydroxybutyrate) depolymerase
MLYEAYQAQRDLTAPARAVATWTNSLLSLLPACVRDVGTVRLTAATAEVVSRGAFTHVRPAWGIDSVTSAGTEMAVREEIAVSTPFGDLIHFVKDGAPEQPRVLLVTALAGHFSTLLRPTARTLLADHDVYVTDWHNARDIPVAEGAFGLDDYVTHLITFLGHIGPGAHVMGVCQPCPATLAAVALLAEDGSPLVPRSMTLMAGPVDPRVNPTAVNDLAMDRPLSWFADNVVTTVPWRYAGAGRRVYPGFLQLLGFMSMNWERHLDQQVNLFHSIAAGDRQQADHIETFYDEYCAVLDLPAEFYLETVDRVFQRALLPQGLLEVGGRRVDPSAITRTALLTVEGERDDICGIGQTMAAQDICVNVPNARRRHHLQPGVGHYGVFSGHGWERQIYPVVRSFILANR